MKSHEEFLREELDKENRVVLRLQADRDALLVWGRGMLAPPGPAREAQLAALPEHLRHQVEKASEETA